MAGMKKFEGSLVALATPFRDGALDEDAYRALIRHVLDNGSSGLVPVGTTGEAATLSDAEMARAVRVAVEASAGKVPVLAGAGFNSTAHTLKAVAAAREAGADGALVVTPYYNKPTQDGLVEHYRHIAKAHPGFPLVVYNVPSRTSVDLSADATRRLLDIPEVVAIKDATASMVRALELLELCGERLCLLSGEDSTVLPFIACGGRGVISVSANVVPRMVADLVQAARASDLARARELAVKLGPLHRALFLETNPVPVKWALHRMKLMGPEIRLPLLPLTAPNAAKLEAELLRLGVV